MHAMRPNKTKDSESAVNNVFYCRRSEQKNGRRSDAGQQETVVSPRSRDLSGGNARDDVAEGGRDVTGRTWRTLVKHGGARSRSHCNEHWPRLDLRRQGHPRWFNWSLVVSFTTSDPVRRPMTIIWLATVAWVLIWLSLSSFLLFLVVSEVYDSSRSLERCCADASVVHCIRSRLRRLNSLKVCMFAQTSGPHVSVSDYDDGLLCDVATNTGGRRFRTTVPTAVSRMQ